MKAFKQGAEIRLTEDDLKDMLQEVLNDRIFSMAVDEHYISKLTFDKNSVFAITITILPKPKTKRK